MQGGPPWATTNHVPTIVFIGRTLFKVGHRALPCTAGGGPSVGHCLWAGCNRCTQPRFFYWVGHCFGTVQGGPPWATTNHVPTIVFIGRTLFKVGHRALPCTAGGGPSVGHCLWAGCNRCTQPRFFYWVGHCFGTVQGGPPWATTNHVPTIVFIGRTLFKVGHRALPCTAGGGPSVGPQYCRAPLRNSSGQR